MDYSKYSKQKDRKRLVTYTVPLPPDVEAELASIKVGREWARDLIVEHLPKLKEHLKAS